MKMKELSQKINEIEMPEEMKKRIIHNCYKKTEENRMNANKKKNTVLKKSIVALASAAACFCVVSLTTLAATGKLEGFFKDITNWNGTVIGTSYEQASDEISLTVVSVSGELTVVAEMLNPNVVPYMTFETFGIANYEIADGNGNIVLTDGATEYAKIIAGKSTIEIPISELPNGAYKLVVHEFVGSSKADQPLILNGYWECAFTR